MSEEVWMLRKSEDSLVLTWHGTHFTLGFSPYVSTTLKEIFEYLVKL